MTERDQTPAIAGDDDTEGHSRRFTSDGTHDDDTRDGVIRRGPEDDDVTGHSRRGGTGDDDAKDDDTEGHEHRV
jgi:hypothetical protein